MASGRRSPGAASPSATARGLATANGIVVQSQQNPGPPGSRYSLLAWLPVKCCALTVTNTATRSATTVHSPLPGGFALGGAFSPAGPAGAWLAVCLNAGSGASARLALVDLATGALRVVPGVRVALGADIAWPAGCPAAHRSLLGRRPGAATW